MSLDKALEGPEFMLFKGPTSYAKRKAEEVLKGRSVDEVSDGHRH